MTGVMGQSYRRTIPQLIVFLGGLILLVEYFLPVPGITPAAGALRSWSVLIFGFTVIFGVSNLLIVHLRRIRVSRRVSRSQSFYSLWLVIMFLIFFIPAMVLPRGLRDPGYVVLYNTVYATGFLAVYGLCGLWFLLTVYRSLRAKNIQASVLMIGALLTMLGLAPWGEAIWPGFVTIKDWILSVPLTGGMRAITITAAIAIVATCIRTLLGQEKSYLGR